jgi:hypothetical protein
MLCIYTLAHISFVKKKKKKKLAKIITQSDKLLHRIEPGFKSLLKTENFETQKNILYVWKQASLIYPRLFVYQCNAMQGAIAQYIT